MDEMWGEYPATDSEALAARTQDKRINPMWLEACYEEAPSLTLRGAPALVGLDIYQAPVKGEGVGYIIGADPAEGNPNSDDSALTVLREDTGEEVAVLAAKLEPEIFADAIKQISHYYNDAPVMVERNNHGHAVVLWLRQNGDGIRILRGTDHKAGWLTNSLGKANLYAETASHFREYALDSTKVLHSFKTYQQLGSIDGTTLSAPKGQFDDRADSYALALVGRVRYALIKDRQNNTPPSTSFAMRG
jgi:hypothetical protein